jgi:alpha-methylacyl-CoA racemase
VIEARSSGRGQVIDAAMVDGVATRRRCSGACWRPVPGSETRGANVLGRVARRGTTRTRRKTAGFVAIGAIEPKFYRELLERLQLLDTPLPEQQDRADWPALRAVFTRTFREAGPATNGARYSRAPMPASRRC